MAKYRILVEEHEIYVRTEQAHQQMPLHFRRSYGRLWKQIDADSEDHARRIAVEIQRTRFVKERRA